LPRLYVRVCNLQTLFYCPPHTLNCPTEDQPRPPSALSKNHDRTPRLGAREPDYGSSATRSEKSFWEMTSLARTASYDAASGAQRQPHSTDLVPYLNPN
jgi:hypothetical protein